MMVYALPTSISVEASIAAPTTKARLADAKGTYVFTSLIFFGT
jgi:hypothetical protein